jgi:MFS family permease
LMLLANTYLTILLTTAFFGLGTALQIPALTSLTSKRATVSQGVAMGLSNSFVSLGRIFGPVFGGAIFDINIFLPYLGGSAIMSVGFIMSLVTLKRGDQVAGLSGRTSGMTMKNE